MPVLPGGAESRGCETYLLLSCDIPPILIVIYTFIYNMCVYACVCVSMCVQELCTHVRELVLQFLRDELYTKRTIQVTCNNRRIANPYILHLSCQDISRFRSS